MSENAAAGGDGAAIRLLPLVQDGLVAGLLGAFAVALSHLVADSLAGSPLHTPSVLGVLLADGAEAARNAPPDVESAFRFTCIHIAVWVALGIGASSLVSLVDTRPRFASVVFASLTFFFVSLTYVAGGFSVPGLRPLHLWLGTVVGAAVSAGYLVWRHPKLVPHIEREHLTETTRRELARALAHETAGHAAYQAAAARFPDSALRGLLEEKQGRLEMLRQLVAGLDLAPGEPEEAQLAWQAETPEKAVVAALAFERETIALYDRYLAAVPEMKVRDVFLRLRYHALDSTIPKLEQTRTPDA